MSLHGFAVKAHAKITKSNRNYISSLGIRTGSSRETDSMFTPLFAPAIVQEVPVLHAGLAAAIKACQQDLQTGLIEVNLPGRPCFDLLFVRGQMVNAYQRSEVTERLSPDALLSFFPHYTDAGLLRALALTPQAIRLAKILLEHDGSGQPGFIQTEALETQIETWSASPDPGLVHVCWQGAEALALLPGGSQPPRQTLFIAADQILHSATGMMALFGWKEETCTATFYGSASQTQAWQEYLLHTSFVWVMGHLLSHFEELTGPLVLDAVVRETNFTAAARGWNISLGSGNVIDQMIFGSTQEAVQVYRQLMETILNYMGSILGAEVLKPLMRESLMRLQPAYRRTFQEHFAFFEQAGSWPVQAGQNA